MTTANLFPVISSSDCARLIADARRQPNVAWQQIRVKLNMSETHVLKLLADAVEAALDDADQAIASAEESQLRVPSDHIRDRAKLYRRALNAYYTTFPADGSAHPESRRVEAKQERGGDILTK
jgi:acyl-CoA reductase-like NAD-dependent aldehyde dehydrogenase